MTPRILLVKAQAPTEWARRVSEQTGATFAECPESLVQAAEDFRKSCRSVLPALVLTSPEFVPQLTVPAAAFGVPLLGAETFDAQLQSQVAVALQEKPTFPAAQIAGPLLETISWQPQHIAFADATPEGIAETLTQRFPGCTLAQIGSNRSDTVVVVHPVTEGSQSEHLLRMAHHSLLPHGRLVAFFLSGMSPMAAADWCDGQWSPPRSGFMPPSPVCGFSFDGLRVLLARTHWKAQCLKEDILRAGSLSFPGWVAILERAVLTGGSYAQSRRAWRTQAQRVNARGEELWREGQAAAAEVAFEKAVSVWNRDAATFNNLGAAHYTQQRLEEALARFTDALHLDPYHAAARANLIMAADALGREDEAEKLLALFPSRDLDQEEEA